MGPVLTALEEVAVGTVPLPEPQIEPEPDDVIVQMNFKDPSEDKKAV